MMKLRPYQQDVVRTLERNTCKRVCLVQHMGTGKTTEAAEYVHRTGLETLWIAHRVELLNQAEAVAPKGVRFMTVQSLVRAKEPPPCDLLVWDECHHAKADEWQRIVKEQYPHARLLGMTATPERPDGKPLGDIFDDLVVSLQPSEFVRHGVIVPTRAIVPEARQKRSLAMCAADACRNYGGHGSTIVFVSTVKEAEKVVAELGPGAAMVTATTPVGERARTLASFRRGLIHVLVNVQIATEGFDAPSAGVIILARNFGHPSAYIQAAGRGSRRAPGKNQCLLVDLADNVRRFGSPDEDRAYSLEGRPISVIGANGGPREPPQRGQLSITDSRLVDYETGEPFEAKPWTFELAEETAEDREAIWREMEEAKERERKYGREWYHARSQEQRSRWLELERERLRNLSPEQHERRRKSRSELERNRWRNVSPEQRRRRNERERERYARRRLEQTAK